MADTNHEGASNAAGIDLTQFYQVFFEEAGENLQTMEQMLLELDVEAADDEELNAIFRCAHSVKGGAATFGFQDVAALTHQMEALLDKLRRHELTPTVQMVDVLLAAGDSLCDLLGRHQGVSVDEPIDATQCGGKENCLGEGNRCMTHDLWASLNTRMVEFLDSVTLQKLVDDQLAKGLQVEDKPTIKRAISAMPVVKPIRINAPNSVFALGNAFSKS